MEELYAEKCPELKWKVMDVQEMTDFGANQFDAVIDKGMLDSILCGDNSRPNCEEMINEVYRVLEGDGVYVCISYGYPEERIHYFKNPDFNWEIKAQKVNKMTTSTLPVVQNLKDDPDYCHYIYVLKKLDGPSKPVEVEPEESKHEEADDEEREDELDESNL